MIDTRATIKRPDVVTVMGVAVGEFDAGLERFEPPAGFQRLIVAGDNDASGRGQEAPHALAMPRDSHRCEVVVSLPPGLDGQESADWADMLIREVGWQ